MFKESFTLTLRKPRVQVFETLTDIRKLSLLSRGNVSIEEMQDRPSSGTGSAVTIKSSLPGMSEILCEVTEWDAPHRCIRALSIPDLPTTISLSFADAPNPGGTLVTLDVQIEAKSLMYKMMLPMLAKKIKDDKEKALAELQKQLDA